MSKFTELYNDPDVHVWAENELAFAIRDGYPVTPGHTLVIPKREVVGFFELTVEELKAMRQLLVELREQLHAHYPGRITGFNVGVNDGRSAGRTIDHVHVHLIPGRDGDMQDPTGGVRGVIPTKQKYYGPPQREVR